MDQTTGRRVVELEVGAEQIVVTAPDGECGICWVASSTDIHAGKTWDMAPLQRASVVARLRTLAQILEDGDISVTNMAGDRVL